MAQLILPTHGLIYADAQIVIYSTDAHPIYAPLCRPVWQLALTTTISSELILVETLVAPLRSGDRSLQTARENLWRQSNTRMLPITAAILRDAAQLRANIPSLKTPDAIHAATALWHNCTAFVTNDIGFRRVSGLPLILLDDLLAAP